MVIQRKYQTLSLHFLQWSGLLPKPHGVPSRPALLHHLHPKRLEQFRMVSVPQLPPTTAASKPSFYMLWSFWNLPTVTVHSTSPRSLWSHQTVLNDHVQMRSTPSVLSQEQYIRDKPLQRLGKGNHMRFRSTLFQSRCHGLRPLLAPATSTSFHPSLSSEKEEPFSSIAPWRIHHRNFSRLYQGGTVNCASQ